LCFNGDFAGAVLWGDGCCMSEEIELSAVNFDLIPALVERILEFGIAELLFGCIPGSENGAMREGESEDCDGRDMAALAVTLLERCARASSREIKLKAGAVGLHQPGRVLISARRSLPS